MTSLYQQSVPVLILYLRNLSGLLTKGAEYCTTKGTKPEEMLSFRLIADMRGLPYQVQSCCNAAKFFAHRVGGHENVYFADDETTFAQLQARIETTIALLESVDPQAFDGKENARVVVERPQDHGTFEFTGQTYVGEFLVPFFHFHMATAYCIMRHLGVPLGAFDYLGGTFRKVG